MNKPHIAETPRIQLEGGRYVGLRIIANMGGTF